MVNESRLSNTMVSHLQIIDSSGVIDSGKIPVLDASGRLSDTIIPVSTNNLIAQRETQITGVYSWSGAAIASATELNITSGTGVIVDATTDPTMVVTESPSWNADTNFVVSMPNDVGAQYVYVNNSGNILQQSTRLTRAQNKDFIFLLKAEYESGSIIAIVESPRMSQSTGSIVNDFIDYLPDSAKLQGALIRPVDLQLQSYRESGTFFRQGINHFANVKDANVVAIPADGNSSTPLTYDIVLSDETVDSVGVSTFPKEREIAGVATPLTGKRATIHYLFAIGLVNILQMGQFEYNDAKIASASADSDFSNFDLANGLDDAILLAQVVIGNDAVTFIDKDKASIINRRQSGAAGGSTSDDLNVRIAQSTGQIDGGDFSINGGNPAHLDISDGTGVKLDNWTDPTSPVKTPITWTGLTDITLTGILTSLLTFIMIEDTGGGVGGVLQLPSHPTPEQRRDNIFLGVVGHSDNLTITNIGGFRPDSIVSVMSQIADLSLLYGLVNIGNSISPNAAANLTFDKSGGSIGGFNINFGINNKRPHEISTPALSPVTFLKGLQDGTVVASTNILDVGNYDNGGVLTAIPGPGNTSTNHRVFLLGSNNVVVVQPGQSTYPTLSDAVSAIASEQFIIAPPIIGNAILIGVISSKKTTTDLTDTSDATFVPISKWGEGIGGAAGASTTSLQQAYDNSIEPEIVTDSTLSAVSFKRGSASDNDNVIEIMDGSGVITAFIKGNGNMTLQSDTGDTILKLAADLSNDVEADTPYIIWEKDGGDQFIMGYTGVSGEGPDGTAITDVAGNDFLFHSKSTSDMVWATISNARMALSDLSNGYLNLLGKGSFTEGFEIRFGDQDFVMLVEDVDDDFSIITEFGRLASINKDGVVLNSTLAESRAPDEQLHVRGNIKSEGQIYSGPIDVLVDVANIATNFDNGNTHTVTLAGNRTLDNPTNLKDSVEHRWIIKQDVTGGRTLVYDSAFKFEAGIAPVLSTGSNEIDILVGISDGTNIYCNLVKDFG